MVGGRTFGEACWEEVVGKALRIALGVGGKVSLGAG